MFKTWGQKMKPWRKYPMTITNPLHISSVVIDKGETAKLYVTNGKNTFIVATLSKVIPQAQLDLNFSKDDKIKFITKGDATVSLLGYTKTIDFIESLDEDENGSTPFSNGFPSLSFSDFVHELIVKKGANDHNGVAKKEKGAQKSQPELKKDNLKTKKHAIKPSAGGGRTITGDVKITDVMSGKGDEAKPGNNYLFSNDFSPFSHGLIPFSNGLTPFSNGFSPFSNGISPFPNCISLISSEDSDGEEQPKAKVAKLTFKKSANDHNGVAKKEKEAKQAQAQKSQPELKKDNLKTKKHAIKPSAGGGRTITGGVKITDVMSGKGDEAKPGNNYLFSNGFSPFSNDFSPFSNGLIPFSNGFTPFSNGFSPFPNCFSLISSEDSDGEEQPKAKVTKLTFKKSANDHNGVAKKEKEAKRAQAQKSQSEVKKDNLKTKKHAIKASAGGERTITGGVKITDVKPGKGDEAKPGNNVWVHYVGRLQSNNKTFERVLDGKGAKLRLGYSKVIKGFNIGLIGMKVGGKRRITCPPHMAYGKTGCPPFIPPNSTVVFEVELKAVR